MAKVKIYQFWTYDGTNDRRLQSRRWGTLEGIAALKVGVPFMDSGIEVDEEAVRSDIDGLTVRDFDPSPRPQGFQRQVV